MDVTLYTIIQSNVMNSLPFVLIEHPLLRIRTNILVHLTDGLSVRSVSESFNTRSERQASMPVVTGIRKFSYLVAAYFKHVCI